VRLADDNPSSEPGRVRAPPRGPPEYVIELYGALDVPKFALMVHAENLARTIGAQLFGKWW
jgi:hypothetical protein